MIMVVYSCTNHHEYGGVFYALPIMIMVVYSCIPHHDNGGGSILSIILNEDKQYCEVVVKTRFT